MVAPATPPSLWLVRATPPGGWLWLCLRLPRRLCRKCGSRLEILVPARHDGCQIGRDILDTKVVSVFSCFIAVIRHASSCFGCNVLARLPRCRVRMRGVVVVESRTGFDIVFFTHIHP